jgi:hypothetical protein
MAESTKQITLKNVRLAFPSLFEMKQVNGEGKPAYSAAFLMSADDPQVDAVNELIDRIGTEKWGPKAKTLLAAIRGKDAACIHNGDLKAQYEGFEGNYYLSARSYTKVLVVDRDRTQLGAADGKPYAGCYVDANVEIWAQDNQWGKRVNATLRWVQFRRDGDAFAGGAPASEDEVPDISSEEDEEPLV